MEDRDKGKQVPYETGAVSVAACKSLLLKEYTQYQRGGIGLRSGL